MATKRPTKAELARLNDAKNAVELRQKGYSVEDILKETGYTTPTDLLAAIRIFNDTIIFEAREDRIRARQQELDSLNLLLKKCWEIIDKPPVVYDSEESYPQPDFDSVLKAIKMASDLVWKRVQLLGLMKEDARGVGQEVIVIAAETTEEYVRQLEAITD